MAKPHLETLGNLTLLYSRYSMPGCILCTSRILNPPVRYWKTLSNTVGCMKQKHNQRGHSRRSTKMPANRPNHRYERENAYCGLLRAVRWISGTTSKHSDVQHTGHSKQISTHQQDACSLETHSPGELGGWFAIGQAGTAPAGLSISAVSTSSVRVAKAKLALIRT